MKEGEWLARDLGDDRQWRHRVQEFRERPNHDEEKNMSREERDMKSFHGFHVDNDDIKDLAEDIEYFANQVEDFMDPENPLQKEGIKLDAELRWSAGVQNLVKMVMKDFDISSLEDHFNKVLNSSRPSELSIKFDSFLL
jgi:hypothetical protein